MSCSPNLRAMKRTTLSLIAASLIVGPFAYAQNEDKEMQKQLDVAFHAAVNKLL